MENGKEARDAGGTNEGFSGPLVFLPLAARRHSRKGFVLVCMFLWQNPVRRLSTTLWRNNPSMWLEMFLIFLGSETSLFGFGRLPRVWGQAEKLDFDERFRFMQSRASGRPWVSKSGHFHFKTQNNSNRMPGLTRNPRNWGLAGNQYLQLSIWLVIKKFQFSHDILFSDEFWVAP